LYNQKYPEYPVTPILFKNMLTRARQMLGMGQPGEVQALQQWFKKQENDEEEGGLSGYSSVHHDDSNVCDGVFFMSGTMRSAFHRCGQFFNMDATCKTNRFGMQLVLLVGATEILSTAVFAMALILTESTASYNWVLGEVRTAVGEEAWRAVRCVATDGAGCFHAVIEENLPWATHLRCRFHIRTNINKNLRLLYKGDSSSWQLFLRGYYRCINEPSEVRFEQLWTTLMQAHPRVVEYMTKEVYSHRKQLASCYTNKYVTLGAQSTQRGEGMNALIKAWIIPSLPLSYLCEVVKGMSDRQAAKVLLSLCDNRYTPPDRDGPVYGDARKVLTKQAAWLVDVEGSARESYEVRWFAQQPAIPWTHDVHVNDVGVPDVSFSIIVHVTHNRTYQSYHQLHPIVSSPSYNLAYSRTYS
jgi:hypothetical protein